MVVAKLQWPEQNALVNVTPECHIPVGQEVVTCDVINFIHTTSFQLFNFLSILCATAYFITQGHVC